jgi:hypothetical protein
VRFQQVLTYHKFLPSKKSFRFLRTGWLSLGLMRYRISRLALDKQGGTDNVYTGISSGRFRSFRVD